MNRPTNSFWLKRQRLAVLIACALLAMCFAVPQNAQAGKLVHAQGVPSQQVIDNDVFLTGENPVLDGVVNGDVFMVGSEVSVRGEVNGSLFILANKADIQGDISGNVFVAAVTIHHTEGASIGRSLYSLAVSLITESGAEIKRDLRAVAVSANLQSEIGRDTRAVIGLVEMLRLLKEDFHFRIIGMPAMNEQSLASKASGAVSGRVPGPVTAFSSSPIDKGGFYLASARSVITHELFQTPQPAGDPNSAMRQWVLSRFLSLAAFLIVGALGLWLFPDHFSRWTNMIQSHPLASAGYGALVLINGFLIPILLVALSLAITIGLIFLFLPSIAWLFGGAAFGLLAAAFSLFLLLVTYVSKAVVALWFGKFILVRFAERVGLAYPWLALLLGLVLYVLLASIPYLGFAVGLAVTLLGLGAIWLTSRSKETQNLTPVMA